MSLYLWELLYHSRLVAFARNSHRKPEYSILNVCMLSVLVRFRSSKLLKDNSVLFAGSMLAAGLNYLFYPVLGRFLSPAQFGEVQVLATLVVQSALVFGFARVAIISEIANAPTQAEERRLLHFSERLLLQLALVMTVLAIFTVPFVADLFKYESMVPLYVLIPTLALNALRSTRNGYARAKRRFGIAAMTDISASLIKLVLATLLAAAGLGTIGATIGLLGAYAVSAVVMVVITARWGLHFGMRGLWRLDALRLLFKKGQVTKKGALTLSVSAAAIIVTLLSSIDTVFSKASLAPEQAGLYAGISVISNIIFFATGSIAGVLLTSVKPAQARASNLHKYRTSVLLMTSLSAAIALVLCIFPEFVVHAMLGVKYVTASHLLPTLTMAMLAMAGTNLIISYHIAMRDKYILLLALVIGSIVCGSLSVWHTTAAQLAVSFMVSNLIAFVLCLGWTLYWHRKVYTSGSAEINQHNRTGI